jgi:hypothetical protein
LSVPSKNLNFFVKFSSLRADKPLDALVRAPETFRWPDEDSDARGSRVDASASTGGKHFP